MATKKGNEPSWWGASTRVLAIVGSLIAITGLYITWDNSREDRRARIVIKSIDGIQLTAPPEELAELLKRQGYVDIPFTYTYENTGKTPAEKVRQSAAAYLSDQPFNPTQRPDDPTLYRETPIGGPFTGYSNPQDPLRLTFPQMMEWQTGRKFIYVFVRIDYDDTYIFSFRHHTWICEKFDPWGKQVFCPGGKTD